MNTTEGTLLVSIIMPAYNAQRYIKQAVESVKSQTYTNWELIIVDDGSTDETAAIVKDLAAVDGRIQYVFQPNQKLAKARNAGLKQSKGDLIAFLDSDDLWLKEKLQLQVKTIQRTKTDLVFSDGFIFRDDQIFVEATTFSIKTGKFSGKRMFDQLIVVNQIPILSVIVRKSTLEQVGFFDESPNYQGHEDYDLWLSIAKRGYAFYGMPNKLVRYRVHGSAMSKNTNLMMKSELAVFNKHRRDNKDDAARLRYAKKRTAITTLDGYFLKTDSKSVYDALSLVIKAWRSSPLVLLQPRRLIAILRRILVQDKSE